MAMPTRSASASGNERDNARVLDGAAFDLKAWHTKALRLGPIGLEQLGAELAR